MAGYFNDGNGVKNITDGYFYDGDVKYYKDVVITKYWKEVTKDSKELEYGCYKGTGQNINSYLYAKAPLGSDLKAYYFGNFEVVTSSNKLLPNDFIAFTNIADETANTNIAGTYNRYTDGDLYIDTKVTETVEGTPEDYTHTTTETTTVEVSADDEYDYKEYYPKKIKQIYKVINGEAKLIFNNE